MSDKFITIGNKYIGDSQPVFIIAEIGVNHNGDFGLAREMVEIAGDCGADCVKIQTFKAERVVTQNAPKASYQLKTTNPDEIQLEMLKKLEFDPKRYGDLMDLCHSLDMTFMSTPYNIPDIDFLDELGVPAFKLASIHMAEPYIIEYTARKKKPVILSSGMSTMLEVKEGIGVARDTGNSDLILLQCTTNYPSLIEDTNLNAMITMRDELRIVSGYSDHTDGDVACIAAVAMGAKVIEKHFTSDKSLPGPDHTSSSNPKEFKRLVKNIRNTEKALGSAVKKPCEVEITNAVGMRRSIVSNQLIKKGELIDVSMLTFKRPATGLAPKQLYEVVGHKAKRNILPDEFIIQQDVD